jgi:hypothetical protein
MNNYYKGTIPEVHYVKTDDKGFVIFGKEYFGLEEINKKDIPNGSLVNIVKESDDKPYSLKIEDIID